MIGETFIVDIWYCCQADHVRLNSDRFSDTDWIILYEDDDLHSCFSEAK